MNQVEIAKKILGQRCSLTDPTIPTKKIKKWERVEDVPVELWGKALVRKNHEDIYRATIFEPNYVTGVHGEIEKNLVYLPLGQPLTSEWLPFESIVEE